MKRKILLPTDFSDNAWSATQYAIDLYSEVECTFYFLNSYAPTHSGATGSMTGRLLDVLKENSQRDLNKFKAKAEKGNHNTKHEFEVIASSEDMIPAINRAVQNHGINLVIMGTKGASGVSKYFMGSNTVKIVQNFKFCPILAVPENIEFYIPKHIAFPTDFNRMYEDKEINPILDFADLFNSHIHVLHVNVEENLSDLQERNKKTLQTLLQNFSHTFHWVSKSDTKSDEINDFIKDFKIDVLAMVNYKHSFIEGITKEPIIKKIGFKPIVPFLVIPE
jgi:nucleotide-binding universal stress UspA family protein